MGGGGVCRIRECLITSSLVDSCSTSWWKRNTICNTSSSSSCLAERERDRGIEYHQEVVRPMYKAIPPVMLHGGAQPSNSLGNSSSLTLVGLKGQPLSLLWCQLNCLIICWKISLGTRLGDIKSSANRVWSGMVSLHWHEMI